jgi:glycosidase
MNPPAITICSTSPRKHDSALPTPQGPPTAPGAFPTAGESFAAFKERFGTDDEPTAEKNPAEEPPADTKSPEQPWWKDVVCYQVWPISFKDSNGDGHGDIQGVISKLGYLKDLGIDCIWISPTYESPMKDWGYDITNYENTNPKFGTLADMERLIGEVHKRDMKILMDLVVTHTSEEHPWFIESRKDRTNEKADWYIWQDKRPGFRIPPDEVQDQYRGRVKEWNEFLKSTDSPPDDLGELAEEPSNYKAAFGGSAWTEVEERGQYYFHCFLKEQPDLNWECEPMKKALFESAVKFWLDRGVNGFRIDTANRLSKVPDFPDVYPRKLKGSRLQPGSEFYINGPQIHPYLKNLREYIDEHSQGVPMLLGELPLATEDQVMDYVHPDRKELSMIFDFDMVKLGNNDNPDEFDKHQVMNLVDQDESYTLPKFKRALMKVQVRVLSR